MRKWMKGFAIAGVVLLIIGTAVTALAAVAGNFTEDRYVYGARTARYYGKGVFEYIGDVLRTERYNGNTLEIDPGVEPLGESDLDFDDTDFVISPLDEMKLVGSYGSINKIELEAERSAVKIVENPELTDEIRVYIKEGSRSVIETETEEPGELKIKYSWPTRISRGYTEGIVEIPAGYRFREAELEVKAGVIIAEKLNADEFDASVKAAKMVLNHFKAMDADFSVEAGSFTAIGEIDTRLEAEAKAGSMSVSLAGGENDYNYKLENAVGNVTVGGNVYSGLSKDKKVNSGTNKTIVIDCAAGSVDIQFTGQSKE